MRVIVLGGTRFIGRATVEQLQRAGHDVLVVHRGLTEPADLPAVEHLHADRAQLAQHRAALAAFRPDAVLDAIALTRQDAEVASAALPENVRLVVLSSIDVYRAYGALLSGTQSDAVPLDEHSPVREQRYPYRGQRAGFDDYDKLDVEDVYARRRATILRLPMVYGEHDRQRREEFILRRVRAGRRRIPIGAGTWLACRAYVGEIARATCLALAEPRAQGETFNLAERQTASVRLWAEQILRAADAETDTELVRVDDALLPPDLQNTGAVSQHLLADPTKAQQMLGWTHGDPADGLRRSVAWHLANPPTDADPGFEPDDRALASVSSVQPA
jgi:UDP-glucose 4-epimerase